jgi:hypothetical protein
MVCEHPTSRYSEQMETGVLLFLAPGEMRIVKDMAFKVITSQLSLPN